METANRQDMSLLSIERKRKPEKDDSEWDRRAEALKMFEKFLEEPPKDIKSIFSSNEIGVQVTDSYHALSKMKRSTKMFEDPPSKVERRFNRYKV